MTKKVIILVLIFLIIINTIYWISLIAHLDDWRESDFLEGLVRYSSGERIGGYAVKNIITLLIISDAVLIAIFFMIILLYKKRTIGDKK